MIVMHYAEILVNKNHTKNTIVLIMDEDIILLLFVLVAHRDTTRMS